MEQRIVFSSVQSYHNMIMRMLSDSPMLTYVLLELLLNAKKVDDSPFLHSRQVKDDPSDPYYEFFTGIKWLQDSMVAKFIDRISMHGVLVLGTPKYSHTSRIVKSDPSFVDWLQSGVVTLDHQKKLVTLHS